MRFQLSCTPKTLGEGPEGAWEGPAPLPCEGSGQDLVLQAGHCQVRYGKELWLGSLLVPSWPRK